MMISFVYISQNEKKLNLRNDIYFNQRYDKEVELNQYINYN